MTDMWGEPETPTSLRSRDSEERYARAPKGDIGKIRGANIGGLKILPNQYPYDIAYKQNDMLVFDGNFWEYWQKLGNLIFEGKLPYDQIIMNMNGRQSQPHVHHCHLMKFKDNRGEFKL